MWPGGHGDATAWELSSCCVALKADHDATQYGFSVAVGVPVRMLVTPYKPVGVFMVMDLDLVVYVSVSVPQVILNVRRHAGRVRRRRRRRFILIAASNDRGKTGKQIISGVSHVGTLMSHQG